MAISRWKKIAPLIRLDIAEVMRSRWPIFIALFYAILTLLLVGIGFRESKILGFTGMGRVTAALSNAIIIIIPLLGLLISSPVFTTARENGSLELLFSHPIEKSDYFIAISISRFSALLIPLLALFPFLLLLFLLLPQSTALPWKFLAGALSLSITLAWCFTSLGLLLSTLIRRSSQISVYSLLIWLICIAFMDLGLIGAMLQWRFRPEVVFALSTINPVESSRIALISLTGKNLHTLGPVGFFLANKLGEKLVFAIGLLWPAILGLIAWIIGSIIFKEEDLI